jgi:hypothetical protein
MDPFGRMGFPWLYMLPWGSIIDRMAESRKKMELQPRLVTNSWSFCLSLLRLGL